MSYTPITSTEIETGKPVSSTTQTKIKDSFEDHEERIQNLEGGADVTYPCIVMSVTGKYTFLNTVDDLLRTTISFNLRVTSVRLIITTAGASGTTEVDLEYNRSGSWNSIFTTKPSVAYSAGDNATSSNAVLNASHYDLQAGDLLRLNLDSVQAAEADSFIVRIDYIKT